MESVFLDNMGYLMVGYIVWIFGSLFCFVMCDFRVSGWSIFAFTAWIVVPLISIFVIDMKEFNDDQIAQLKGESECVRDNLMLEGVFNYSGLRYARNSCEEAEEKQRKFELLK